MPACPPLWEFQMFRKNEVNIFRALLQLPVEQDIVLNNKIELPGTVSRVCTQESLPHGHGAHLIAKHFRQWEQFLLPFSIEFASASKTEAYEQNMDSKPVEKNSSCFSPLIEVFLVFCPLWALLVPYFLKLQDTGLAILYLFPCCLQLLSGCYTLKKLCSLREWGLQWKGYTSFLTLAKWISLSEL